VKLLEDGIYNKDVKRVTRVITLRADKDLALIRNQFDEKHEKKLDACSYKWLLWMDDYLYKDLIQDIIRGNEKLDAINELPSDDEIHDRYVLKFHLRDC